MTLDKKLQTIQTYNQSAKALADKFDSLGARIEDIEETFVLISKENPKVLEIGCGNGRDAVEITKRTTDYLGIDVSTELIRLAREKVPNAKFEVADITSYVFPSGLDIVFAFASLIHITKDELRTVLSNLYTSLSEKGVVRISLKNSPEYQEITEESEFGIRTYYYYSQDDIKEVSGNFEVLKSEVLERGNTRWLEVILRRN